MSSTLIPNFTDAEVAAAAQAKGETPTAQDMWTVHNYAWRGLDAFELWRNWIRTSSADAIAKAQDLHHSSAVVRSEVKDASGRVIWVCDKRISKRAENS